MSRTRITIDSLSMIAAAFLCFTALLVVGISPAGAAPGQGNSGYYPNVPLINQDGETLHFYDDVIKDKVVTINFMFTSCGDSCPLETAKLRKVHEMLGEHAGKEVHMYSITVDPDRDTPEVLKAYMEKFKLGPGWQFLTGKKEDIDAIRKRLAMYSEEEEDLSDHAINFVLGNEATGQWLKRTPFDLPEALVATLLGRLQGRRIASVATAGYEESMALSSARPGEDLFTTRCTSCHTIGEGDSIGPDLLGVVAKRDRDWMIRWLQEPDAMLEEKDPLAIALFNQYNQVPMPNIRLTYTDALNLMTFMYTESRRIEALQKREAQQADKLERITPAGPAVEAQEETPPGSNAQQNQARDGVAAVSGIK
jgi:protein SCO1/2